MHGKKKLLFVITKGSWGGAGRYVFDLATSLKGEYDVAVALGGKGSLEAKLKAQKIRIIEIPSLTRDITASGDSAAFFELLAIFKRERPDIVHLNSSKAGGLGALAARLIGIRRVVYTAHGWAFNEPVSKLSKIFRWTASLVTLLLCHHVITVSYFDMLHTPFGIKTNTVHNGIAGLDFLSRAEARTEIARRAGIPKDSFIVGTIAELTKNKGIDVLVRATTSLHDSHVVVIGGGEDEMLVNQLIAGYGLQNRFHLLGFIENASRFLKAYDIFVLPSRKEGLPYAILEAGLAGIAVVASSVGGIPEMIDDQLSGELVPAFDHESLAEAVNDLHGSPNTRERYAHALQERVNRHFGLSGMVKRTVEVYET